MIFVLKIAIMRVYLFILVLCCCLLASCSSIGSGFPLEETLTQELMPLQGITNPMLVEIKSPFLILDFQRFGTTI